MGAKSEEESEEELDIDDLMYQVSIDDLQQYLGISIIPDDRARLDHRWAQKIRNPSLRQLLADSKAMEHGYALIPRLPRYLKDGKVVQNNSVTIVRSFPQLFDNVAQIINKYKAEPGFVSEAPELDWSIIACEMLPESREPQQKLHGAEDGNQAVCTEIPRQRYADSTAQVDRGAIRRLHDQYHHQGKHPQRDRRPDCHQRRPAELSLHQFWG